MTTATAALPFAFAGVHRAFGRQRVLRGVDLAPPPGAVVGLLGLNGSGKSTLLKMLVGLLQPDAGTATVRGHDGWDPPDEVKAGTGYVDQQPELYPWLPASELFGYLGSFYPRWDRDLTLRLAAEWDVRLDVPTGKLSPGDRQKVAVIAALAPHPGLLVLDEPVSALDPMARRLFLRELIDLTTDEGGGPTVLLSSHLTADLERVASHVAVLGSGVIRWFGELGELKENARRLRVVGSGPLGARFANGLPGLVHATAEGVRGRVFFLDGAEAAAAELRARPGIAEVEEEGLNLEEAFLEIVRGEAGRG